MMSMPKFFSPNAMGGIITEERIKDFKFKAIIGAANNQLKAISKDEEIRLAKILEDGGIFFAIDWTHNVGGVLYGWAQYKYGERASLSLIEPKIRRVCVEEFSKLLRKAKETGRTTTEIAYETVESIIRQKPIDFDPQPWLL